MYADSDSIRYSGDQYKGRKEGIESVRQTFPLPSYKLPMHGRQRKDAHRPRNRAKIIVIIIKCFFFKIKKKPMANQTRNLCRSILMGQQTKQTDNRGKSVCFELSTNQQKETLLSNFNPEKDIKKKYHKQLNQITQHIGNNKHNLYQY